MATALAPGFLIAVPHLTDPNFRQTVVLLLQQDEQGAMGVVINRESPLLLSDLCSDHDIEYHGEDRKKVRVGGPVQPEQGLVLFGDPPGGLDGREVVDGLHLSASTETLGQLCAGPGRRFHCYSGYSGWGPGQLEREIREGAWILGPVSTDLVLEAPTEEIWARALRELGIDPALIVPGGAQEA